MRRAELVARNRRLAARAHAPTLVGRLRPLLLRTLAAIPRRPSPIRVPQRVLLIRPDHLGDAILTIPAIKALKRAMPEAELHALAGPAAVPVLYRLRELHDVQLLDFPGLQRGQGGGRLASLRLAREEASRLRGQGFMAALILRPGHWWGALLAWLAGIPQRIGYADNGAAHLLTNALPLRDEHAAQRSLRLVQALCPTAQPKRLIHSFPLTRAERASCEQLLRERGIGPQTPFFCIHPGSGAPRKNWETARWASVADILAAQWEARVVLTGSAGEAALAEEIARAMAAPALSLAGETDPGLLAALYEGALLVMGPDSGPMHLADAVGTPTVSLFGPADPREFGPLGPPERHIVLTSPIACRPCRVLDWGREGADWHPCLQDITVMQVLAAARALVSEEAVRAQPVK